MISDPKIDPERMKQWEANTLPVPSAERLKGKGSPPSTCSLSIYEMARRGMKLPKGTRIRTTQGGMPTGGTHEINVDDANKISKAFTDPRPFWCYGWDDLHDSLILPANPTGQERVASADPDC